MTSLSILWIFPRTTSELLSVHYPACILVSQNNCSSEMNIFFSFISSNLLRNSDLNTLIPTKLLTVQRKYNYNVFFSQKKKKKNSWLHSRVLNISTPLRVARPSLWEPRLQSVVCVIYLYFIYLLYLPVHGTSSASVRLSLTFHLWQYLRTRVSQPFMTLVAEICFH